MGFKKLIRFEAIKQFDHVLEYPENMPGKWNEFFDNEHPITLELACGKGEYSVGLGQMYPNRNFIGVDVKGNRIWNGAKKALELGLKNVGFLRTQIDKIQNYFKEDEIDEIWILFPDPQLRYSKMRKRLTHPKFLRMYQQIMKKNGKVHLKTDSPDLFHFTKKVIELYGLNLLEESDNVYALTEIKPELTIKTHYEGLNISGSGTIHYLCFEIHKELPLELDKELKLFYLPEEINDEP